MPRRPVLADQAAKESVLPRLPTDLPTVMIINGPNLNLLGCRETDIYGRETLADIEAACVARAADLGLAIDFRQSNVEGEIVTWIQGARDEAAALILNAGAYTHTSIAILDALRSLDVPVYEVHLSNVFRREPFRHKSYVSMAATGVICGFGGLGYQLALEAAAHQLGRAEMRPSENQA
ncbi:MAG: type II 3-dehydroquinate dehydratase [Rhodospirillales bacterium]|nr:MAG: type II 3-dehydroquinate dehydratase [Rhodospirillales bacterium]